MSHLQLEEILDKNQVTLETLYNHAHGLRVLRANEYLEKYQQAEINMREMIQLYQTRYYPAVAFLDKFHPNPARPLMISNKKSVTKKGEIEEAASTLTSIKTVRRKLNFDN